MKPFVINLTLIVYWGIGFSPIWAQDHFQSLGPTSESYSIIVTSAVIDGNTIEVGDEIGVFTPAGLCVGAAKLPPLTNIQLAAWKDDPQTPLVVDGYTPGDTMRFKIWDSSAQLELSAKAIYQLGNGTFENGLYAIVSLAAISNRPPVITLTGPFQFPEDDSLKVSLLNAATDPNDPLNSLTWQAESGMNIRAVTNQATKILTLTTRQQDWNGRDTLKLTVEDPHGAKDTGTFVVTVTAVNDAPRLQLPTSVTFNEDNTQILFLDNYVADVDNADAEMKWTVISADTTKLKVHHDAAKREARLTPALNWNGRLSLSMKVEDPGQASASGTLPVIVAAVNDPPSIPQLLAPTEDQIATSLKWSKSVDPDSGAVVRYSVQMAPDSNFATGRIEKETAVEELAISTVGSQLTAGKIYYWRVQALDQQNASSGFSRKWSFKYEGGNTITEVENGLTNNLPFVFALPQNYPNPVSQSQNAMTVIRIDLPEARHVSLQIFNLLGQSVRHLINAEMPAGYHRIVWDLGDDMRNRVPVGVYFCQLKAGNVNLVRKLAVVK
ncbi:MAG: Ig-like domain-containing protein [candidate division KSB1 bacterium]|nr:Ig-like domain-containing protein [candidate division KSB1 bacterium]MDZ7303870.1 Ig-like domain-containing protein [candidate division KSB1 bacterium]MDZ7313206.1 Ig-like domain-containing protein [candidate division KSB1 bacterium]